MKEYIVTKDNLNIRSSPTDASDANYIGSLRKGESIFLADEELQGKVPIGGTSPIWKLDSLNRVVALDGVELSFAEKQKEFMDDPFNADLIANHNGKEIDWAIIDLEIWKIWRDYTRGEGTKVAVLDSGYNVNNTDLANGVTDSTVSFKSKTDVTVNDTFGHGSHCASLIGGRNQNYITGYAPACALYISKICPEDAVGEFDDIVRGIQWAIDHQVDVISISNGADSSDDGLEAIINTAVNDHNIVVLASIGNNSQTGPGLPCYPALYKNCIAVGATNQQHEISSATVLDNKTWVNAPGENILGYARAKIPETKTGTSQATAIVAGITALIISRLKKAGQSYTVNDVREHLINNSGDITGSPTQKLISPVKLFKTL